MHKAATGMSFESPESEQQKDKLEPFRNVLWRSSGTTTGLGTSLDRVDTAGDLLFDLKIRTKTPCSRVFEKPISVGQIGYHLIQHTSLADVHRP